jgi:orotidine-5'-phosphate decarboxylase
MKPHERIIFALDVPNLSEAQRYVSMLTGHVGMFKIGLELFMAEGPTVVDRVDQGLGRVMLDLKLHDIPETVERAVLRAADMGVRFLTLHVQQWETLTRVARLADEKAIQPLAVTVLTSMSEEDGGSLGLGSDLANRVCFLARFAQRAGITGFVCSPREVAMLRGMHPGAILVVPGIRPTGSGRDDQKRTGTPAQAIRDGADFLVVGRPIRDAEDPVEAADMIAQEIGIGLSKKM